MGTLAALVSFTILVLPHLVSDIKWQHAVLTDRLGEITFSFQQNDDTKGDVLIQMNTPMVIGFVRFYISQEDWLRVSKLRDSIKDVYDEFCLRWESLPEEGMMEYSSSVCLENELFGRNMRFYLQLWFGVIEAKIFELMVKDEFEEIERLRKSIEEFYTEINEPWNQLLPVDDEAKGL